MWSRRGNIRDQCSDLYERVEYVKIVGSTAVEHTLIEPIEFAVGVELVQVCGQMGLEGPPTITIVTGVNDALDLFANVGGTPTAFRYLIPAGTYTLQELGDLLEPGIEAATPGDEDWNETGWDPVNNRFVFGGNKAAQGLDFGSGPSAAREGHTQLGFASVDQIGSGPFNGTEITAATLDTCCFHILSEKLGSSRWYTLHDDAGKSNALMWVVGRDGVKGPDVTCVSHYPPNPITFTWGEPKTIREFDISLIDGSDYLSGQRSGSSITISFNGVLVLRFICQRHSVF